MSTEKTIRIQAKSALKGNWVQIIISMIIVCIVMVALIYAEGGVQFALGCFNNYTGELIKSKEILYYIVLLVGTVFLLLLSPLVNGVFRELYKVASGQEADVSDVTYYFRHRYMGTVVLNFVLAIIYGVVSTVFDFELWTSVVFEAMGTADTDIAVVGLTIIGIGTAILDVIFAIIIFIYPLFVYVSDDELGVGGSLASLGTAVKNRAKLVRLTFTFTGWLLLCFFVVPAFYVVPYLMTSYAVSARWIIQMNKNII